MIGKSKTQNFELVRDAVRKGSATFTNRDIQNATGLCYVLIKKYLQTMIDFGEVRYSETTKIYMRLDLDEPKTEVIGE